MKKVFLGLVLTIVFIAGTAGATAPAGLNFVEMGDVKYNYTGPRSKNFTASDKTNIANFYGNDLDGSLINQGVSVLDSDLISKINRMRRENDLLNQGRGGLFDGQYKKYGGDLPPAAYKIEATINLWELQETGKNDINVNVRIIDTQTGEVVGHTSAWKRNTDVYLNEQIIGPQPTWWEKYISGYVREITFDDMIEATVVEAAKDIYSQLGELGVEGAVPDAERFSRRMRDQQARAKAIAESGYRPLVPDEVRNPKPESSKSSDSPYFELYVATDGAETWFFKPKACEELFSRLPTPKNPYPNWKTSVPLMYCGFDGGTDNNIFDEEELEDIKLYLTDIMINLNSLALGKDAQEYFEETKTTVRKYYEEHYRGNFKSIDLLDGNGFFMFSHRDDGLPLGPPFGDAGVYLRLGNCIANYKGYISSNMEKFKKYHYFDREKNDFVNLHPDYDHGEALLYQKMLEWAPKIYEGIKPLCEQTVNLKSSTGKQ